MLLLTFMLLENTTLSRGYDLLNQPDPSILKLTTNVLYGYILVFILSTIGEITLSIIILFASTNKSMFTNDKSLFLTITLFLILVRSVFILSAYIIRKIIDQYLGYYVGGSNEESINNYRLIRRLQENIK